MASVEIVGAAKNFGAHGVLHGISLDVRDGEFVVLVGPSGCGKSTLLRMIAGLEGITAGEVLIGGRVVNDLAPKERDIAMVFQNYALYPHMRVAENMSFSLRLARRPRAAIAEQVDRAARILDLQQLLARYPKELSGGQRQRVAMGRSIVRDPAVFLFDEPLSNLDAMLRVAMRAEIKALHRRLGSTMIYVTHDQIEAMTMADRIVVMRDGRIEQVGTPLELYDRPANTFVATFIGSPAMNLIPGRLESSPEGPRLHVADGQSWPLPEGMPAEPGRSVSLGFRPEDLRIAPDGIRARVVVTEPTGAETHVVLSTGSSQVMGVFRDRLVLEPDQQVHLQPDWARVHLFDAATGRRLPSTGLH